MEQESRLRERLIDVGVELVLTEGTAALGLREIARRAGVSHGAPRRYFATHHALLSAIARRGFADLGARFAAAVGGAEDPRAQVRALGCAYVGYALEHRGMFELMFRHDLLDSTGTDGPPGSRLRESTLPLFQLLVDLVARCRAEDTAACAGTDSREATAVGAAVETPQITAAALWANLHGVAQLWAWGSLPLVLGDAPRASVDRLVAAALDAHLGARPRP